MMTVLVAGVNRRSASPADAGDCDGVTGEIAGKVAGESALTEDDADHGPEVAGHGASVGIKL